MSIFHAWLSQGCELDLEKKILKLLRRGSVNKFQISTEFCLTFDEVEGYLRSMERRNLIKRDGTITIPNRRNPFILYRKA